MSEAACFEARTASSTSACRRRLFVGFGGREAAAGGNRVVSPVGCNSAWGSAGPVRRAASRSGGRPGVWRMVSAAWVWPPSGSRGRSVFFGDRFHSCSGMSILPRPAKGWPDQAAESQTLLPRLTVRRLRLQPAPPFQSVEPD